MNSAWLKDLIGQSCIARGVKRWKLTETEEDFSVLPWVPRIAVSVPQDIERYCGVVQVKPCEDAQVFAAYLGAQCEMLLLD